MAVNNTYYPAYNAYTPYFFVDIYGARPDPKDVP